MRPMLRTCLLLTIAAYLLPGSASAQSVNAILDRNPGVVYFDGSHKFYKRVTTTMQWETAKANAEATFLEGVRGRLVEIYSASENEYVYNNLTGGSYMWTGGNDKDKEGEWKWAGSGKVFWRNGSAVDGMFSHWSIGEPNNCCGGENYLHLWPTDKAWNDLYPYNCGYIIEWPAELILGSGTTPTARTPITWMVRVSGNDAQNGTSRGTAFRTIQKAASVALEGDSIYVGAGIYDETVRPIYSGTAARPISYIADTTGAITGDSGTVTIRRSPGQGNAINCYNKYFLNITGFTFLCTDKNNANAYAVHAPWTQINYTNCTATGWYYGFSSYGRGSTYTNCTANNNRYWGFALFNSDFTATNCEANDNGSGGFHVHGYRVADPTRETDYFGYGKVTMTNCRANRNISYNVNIEYADVTLNGGTFSDSTEGRGIAVTCGRFIPQNGPTFSNNGYNVQLAGRSWNLDSGRDDYTLENLTSSNARYYGLLTYYYDLTMKNCTFNNNGQWGHVAYLSSINAENCTANNNTNGGFYNLGYKNWNYWNEHATSFNYDTNLYKNCTANGNRDYGVLTYFGKTKFEGGTYRDNTSHGVYVVYGGFEWANNPTIVNNGYGVTLAGPDQSRTKRAISLSGLSVTGNKWHGLLVYNYDLTLTNCNFSSNNVVDNNGWGLVAYYSQITMSNCTTNDNGYGGVYIYDSVPADSGLATYNYRLTGGSITNNKTHGLYFYHTNNTDSGWDSDTRGELRLTGVTVSGNGYGVYSHYINTVLANTSVVDNTSWGMICHYGQPSLTGTSVITRNGGGLHMSGRWYKQLKNQLEPMTLSNLTISGNKGNNLNVYHYDLTLTNVTLSDNVNNDWSLFLYYSKLTANNLTIRNCGYGIHAAHYAWHKHYWQYYRNESWYKDPGGWWYEWRLRLGIDENTEIPMPTMTITNSTIEDVVSNPIYNWTWNAGDWYDYSNRSKHLHDVTLTNVTIRNPNREDSGSWSLQLQRARVNANNVTVSNRRYGMYVEWGELNTTGPITLTGRSKDVWGFGLWLSAPLNPSVTSATFSNFSISNFWGTVSLSGGWPSYWSTNPDRISVTGVDFSRFTNTYCQIWAEYAHLALTDCTIKNSSSYGIYAPHTALNLSRCTVRDNTSFGIYHYDYNWIKLYLNNTEQYGTYWRDTYWPIFVERLTVDAGARRSMPAHTISDCTFANQSYGIYTSTSNSSRYYGLTGMNDPEWSSYEHTLTLNGNTFDTHSAHHILMYCGKLVASQMNQIRNKGWAIYLGYPIKTDYTAADFQNFTFTNVDNTLGVSGWWPSFWQANPQRFTFTGLNFTSATTGYQVHSWYGDFTFIDCTFQNAGGWSAGSAFAKPTYRNCRLIDSKYGGAHYSDYNWVLMDYDYYVTQQNVAADHWYRTSTLRQYQHWGIDPSADRPMASPTFDGTTITTTGSYGIHGWSWGGRNWNDFDHVKNDYTLTLNNTTISGPRYVGVEMYRGRIAASGMNNISGSGENSDVNCDWGMLIRETGPLTFDNTIWSKFNLTNVEWNLGFYGYSWDYPKNTMKKLTLRDLAFDDPTSYHGIHTWFYDVDIRNCSISNHKSWGFYFHLGKLYAKGLTIDGSKSNNWNLGATDYNWWKIYYTDLLRAYGQAWMDNWMIGVNKLGVTTDMFTRTMSNPVFEDCTLTNVQYGIYTYGWNPVDGTWDWGPDTFDGTLAASDHSVMLTNCTVDGRYSEANAWTYGQGIQTNRGRLVATGTNTIGRFTYGALIYDPPQTVIDGGDYTGLALVNNGYGLHISGTWMNMWSSGRSQQRITVRDFQFSGNRSAGLYVAYLDAAVENCDFNGNLGWGAISYYSKPTYTNCRFSENASGIFFYDYDWVHWYKVYFDKYADANWKSWFTNSFMVTCNKWRIDPENYRAKYDVLIDRCSIKKLTNPDWSGHGIHGYTGMNVEDWYPLDMSKHNYTFTLKDTTIEGTGHAVDIYRSKFRATGTNRLTHIRNGLLLYEHGESIVDGAAHGINAIAFEEVNTHLYFHQFWPAFWTATPPTYTWRNLQLAGAVGTMTQAYYCNLTVEDSSFKSAGGWGVYTGHTNVTMNNVLVQDNEYGIYNYDWNWVKQYYDRAKAGESGMSGYLAWDESLPKYGIDWSKKGERAMPRHTFTNCRILNNLYGIHGYSWNGTHRNWWDNDRDRDGHTVTVNNCTLTGRRNSDGGIIAPHGIYCSRARYVGTGTNSIRDFSYGIYFNETPMRTITGTDLSSFVIEDNGWAMGFGGRYDKYWQGQAYDLTLKDITVSGNKYGIAASYLNLTVDNLNIDQFDEYIGFHSAHNTLNANRLRINAVNAAHGLYFYDYNWLREYEWSWANVPGWWPDYKNSWGPWLEYLGVDAAAHRPICDLTLTNSEIVAVPGNASWGVYAWARSGNFGEDWATIKRDTDLTVSMGNCAISGFNYGVLAQTASVVGTAPNTLTGRDKAGVGLYYSNSSFETFTGDNVAQFTVNNYGTGVLLHSWWPASWWTTNRPKMAISDLTMLWNNDINLQVAYYDTTLNNVEVQNATYEGVRITCGSLVADNVRISDMPSGHAGLYFYDYNWVLEYYHDQNKDSVWYQRYLITQPDRNLKDCVIKNSTVKNCRSSYGIRTWNREKSYANANWQARATRSSLVELENVTVQDGCTYAIISDYNDKVTISRSKVLYTNTGRTDGRGIRADGNKDVVIDRSVVRGHGGWGVLCRGGNVTVKNSLIADNAYGVYLGGEYNAAYYPLVGKVLNTTIANSSGAYSFYQYSGGTVDITNCILAGTGTTTYGMYRQGGVLNHSFNQIHGHSNSFVNTTQGNRELVSFPPRFADPANGDYHLTQGSRAVNHGTTLASQVDIDYDGNARPLWGYWDMGCYESTIRPGVRFIDKWDEVSKGN